MPDTETTPLSSPTPDSSPHQSLLKKTWEKIRRPTTPELKIKLPSAIEQALEKTKGTVIFGKPLHEFALGLVAGSVVKGALKKETAKQLISLGLLQGTMGSAIVVGAVAGGGYAFGREYVKQLRQNWAETEKLKKQQAQALHSTTAAFLSPENQAKLLDPEKARLHFRERLRGWKPNDGKRLAIATARGAILGAVGGAIGFGVAGLVEEYISGISLTSVLEHAKETVSNVTSHLPSVSPGEALTAAESHLPDLSNVVLPTVNVELPTISPAAALSAAEAHLPDLSNPLHHEASDHITGQHNPSFGKWSGVAVSAEHGVVSHGPGVDQATSHFPPGWSAEHPSAPAPEPTSSPNVGIGEQAVPQHGLVPPTDHHISTTVHPGENVSHPSATDHSGVNQANPTTFHNQYGAETASHPVTAHPGENTSHPSAPDHNSVNQGMPKESIDENEAVGLMNPQLQEAVHNLPAEVKLQPGGNVWQVTHDSLKQALGHEPSNAQILDIAKVVAHENGIAVKEWGIEGTVDARHLEVGRSILINDNVKNAMLLILTKK